MLTHYEIYVIYYRFFSLFYQHLRLPEKAKQLIPILLLNYLKAMTQFEYLRKTKQFFFTLYLIIFFLILHTNIKQKKKKKGMSIKIT